MRFYYESSTETEGEEQEENELAAMKRQRDVKGKGRSRERETSVSPSSSPSRSRSVRISVPPESTTTMTAATRTAYRSRSNNAKPRASTSSSGSPSSEDDADDSDEDSETYSSSDDSASVNDSDSDSEEDEFPVNPSKADMVARRRLNQYPAQADPLENYIAKQQKKAWQSAQASYNRDLAALRNIRLNAFAQAETQRKKLQEEELEMTRLLLEDLNMKRLKEEEEIDREFSSRNAKRWNEINNAIADLELKEKQNAAILENAKRKQLEAEAKAREMRELELKKIQQEQEQEEQRKKKEELEQKEQREKTAQAAQERAKKEKEEAGKAAVGVPAGGASSSSASPSTKGGPPPASNAVSYLLESKREFERWHLKIKDLKETILPAVSNNKELKSACWKLKRSLSTRISNVSASKLDIQNTSSTIHTLLIDAKTANEQAYLWSLNLLSKKITEMAGNNSEPDLSPVTYALAQIVVSLLLADHKSLGDILMARLVKRCPYIVPFFVSKGTLSPEEHSKLLGRKENEPPISYKQRMSGIISLYAAIVQTSPSSVPQLTSTPLLSSVPSHFRPEGGWRWLALIVRPPLPLLEVTALVLYTFLRISSERFHQIFGQQYIKLLRAIAEQAIDERKVKWNDAVQGDLSKIRIMIGEWMEKGQIVGAEGRIPT